MIMGREPSDEDHGDEYSKMDTGEHTSSSSSSDSDEESASDNEWVPGKDADDTSDSEFETENRGFEETNRDSENRILAHVSEKTNLEKLNDSTEVDAVFNGVYAGTSAETDATPQQSKDCEIPSFDDEANDTLDNGTSSDNATKGNAESLGEDSTGGLIIQAKNPTNDKKTFIWETSFFSITAVFPKEVDFSTAPREPKKIHNRNILAGENKCPVCNEDYQSIRRLDEHFIKSHPGVHGAFGCEKCSKKFDKKDRLKAHFFHFHTEEGRLVWRNLQNRKNQRRRGVPIPQQVKDHRNKNRRERYKSKTQGLVRLGNSDQWIDPNADPPFICPNCGEDFDTVAKLRRHHAVTHQDRCITCHICGKGFSTPSSLSSHMRGHVDNRPYVCEECGSTFKTSSHLFIHKRRTHDENGRLQYKLYNRETKKKRAEWKKKQQMKELATNSDATRSDNDNTNPDLISELLDMPGLT